MIVDVVRRLFTFASAVSLMVFVASVACNIAGRGTTFGWTSHHTLYESGDHPRFLNHDIVVSNGVLYDMGEDSGDTRFRGRSFVDNHRILNSQEVRGLNRDRTTGGFSWHEMIHAGLGASGTIVQRYWQRSVPMWVLEVAALVLPIAWLLVFLGDRRRAARIRVGRCESCGYDLTGNTSGVCPECGAAIVRSAPANMPGV